ncbi:MAG: hypothetical protein EA415_09280 [Sphaerobacteraceae bacterium]|nr:MAG: hypothetical protein EA415_09280 [Sphaerobacteraceae bacterium]
MFPTWPDFAAMGLQIGNYLLEIGPFILFGAVVASAKITLLGRSEKTWTGYRLVAPVAAIPLGILPVAAAALRSWLIARTGTGQDVEPTEQESGTFRRAISYAEGLVFPFMISAAIGAAIIVMTPTEPLWTLLSADSPWRLIIAPVVAGLVKPRGGSELPLVMAMITKGLDPVGAVAAILGAGYLHARSIPLAMVHIVGAVVIGAILWQTGLSL